LFWLYEVLNPLLIELYNRKKLPTFEFERSCVRGFIQSCANRTVTFSYIGCWMRW